MGFHPPEKPRRQMPLFGSTHFFLVGMGGQCGRRLKKCIEHILNRHGRPGITLRLCFKRPDFKRRGRSAEFARENTVAEPGQVAAAMPHAVAVGLRRDQRAGKRLPVEPSIPLHKPFSSRLAGYDPGQIVNRQHGAPRLFFRFAHHNRMIKNGMNGQPPRMRPIRHAQQADFFALPITHFVVKHALSQNFMLQRSERRAPIGLTRHKVLIQNIHQWNLDHAALQAQRENRQRPAFAAAYLKKNKERRMLSDFIAPVRAKRIFQKALLVAVGDMHHACLSDIPLPLNTAGAHAALRQLEHHAPFKHTHLGASRRRRDPRSPQLRPS